MKVIDIYDLLLNGSGHFTTREVAVQAKLPLDQASKALKKLAALGRVVRISRGKWTLLAKSNRLKIPELLANRPAYCTAHTALFYYGMISQIPNAIHAASPARSRQEATPFGRVKIHQMAPEMFTGWISNAEGAKIASPEKAMVDYFYLGTGGDPEFQTLPELEIPNPFSWEMVKQLAGAIPNKGRRQAVRKRVAKQREICAVLEKEDTAEM